MGDSRTLDHIRQSDGSWFRDWMVGATFGSNSLRTWLHPASPVQAGVAVMVWGISSWPTSAPFGNNSASFKCHSLPQNCCWPRPSLYDHSVHGNIMRRVTKLASSQTGSSNTTMSSLHCRRSMHLLSAKSARKLYCRPLHQHTKLSHFHTIVVKTSELNFLTWASACLNRAGAWELSFFY